MSPGGRRGSSIAYHWCSTCRAAPRAGRPGGRRCAPGSRGRASASARPGRAVSGSRSSPHTPRSRPRPSECT
eukprot:51745-Prymnesium_polylepis.1